MREPDKIGKPLHGLGYKYAARLLMVSFFLPMKLQVVAAVVACLYFIVRAVKLKAVVPRRSYLWALIIAAPYLLLLLSIPLTPHEYMKGLLFACEQKVSILFMPFVFATVMPLFGELILGELIFFVYGCLVAAAAGNAAFAYQYFFGITGGHALSHVEYRTIFHQFTYIHPTYMSMYLCFSICILLLYETAVSKYVVVRNILLYLLVIGLLSLGAKTPMMALVAIFVHYAWSHRKTLYNYRMLFGGLVLTVAAAWIFIPFVSQRIGETMGFFNTGKPGNVIDNSVYVRKVIWNMDTELLKQYWLTGVGPGRLMPLLHQHYFFYSLNNALPVPFYDPHNEYIYEWLSFGLIGIVCLSGVLVLHFLRAYHNHLYLYLLIILVATFFTESVLSLQRGVMFYGVFTAMMFYPRPKILNP